jgi:glycosyltransferase involved in cell wall biosynthesis
MAPRLSIIVPTFNGEKKIPILLAALQKQTFTDFELIVVIDGSTDQTDNVVQATETFFQKRVVIQTNQGRSVVKNNGAREAIADTLIFFDDDMEPAPDSVQNHFLFHQNHFGLLSGNSLEPSGELTDIQRYKVALTNKWISKFDNGLSELNKSNLFFTSANCSMQKAVFNQLSGFDNRLTDAEDFDFAFRALEKNIPVYFDKDNRAVHYDFITCRKYISRTRQYYAAHEKLKALYPTRLSSRNKVELTHFRRLVYFFFGFAWWPSLIDNFNLLLLLIRPVRFKVYDWIIFSLSTVYPNRKI